MLTKLQRDILKEAQEANVEMIQLQFTDILGQMKNVSVTVHYLAEVLEKGIMFDGSSIEGFTRVQESDMYLVPDVETFSILPWRTDEGDIIARFICDVLTHNGEPFAGCPRHLLRRAIRFAAAAGYTMYAGPEPEFFLFETDSDGKPLRKTHDKGGYFDLSPSDRGENTRTTIVKALESMGFSIEASHHEVAPGQHEVDFRFSDALTAADNLVTFKYVTKAIAAQNRLHAAFIPKPLYGEAGSGLHIHQSLYMQGHNHFHDSSRPDGLSDAARHYIGGLLTHARAMTAITNPTVNSYKRLVAGYEAPVDVTWSAHNRSALIRIPTVRGDSTRIEYRSPDPAANPYLVLALMLHAGLDGIQRQLDPGPATTDSAYELTSLLRKERGIALLPEDLKEALQCLSESRFVQDVLGDHIYEHFMKAKLIEWGIYRSQVHNWELEQYLETI